MNTNLVEFKTTHKSAKQLAFVKDIQNVELYKTLYKKLNKIRAVIDSAAALSQCVYQDDYRDHTEMYLTLHTTLSVLSEKMEEYKDTLTKISFNMDNRTYETIQNRTDDLLPLMNDSDTPINDIKFKIQVLRGETICI